MEFPSKKINILLSLLFAFLLMLPWALYYTNACDDELVIEEKRELFSYPKEISNDYLKRIELWFEDNAPLRVNIIFNEKKYEQKIETHYRESLFPLLSKVCVPDWYIDEKPYLATLLGEDVVFGRNNWLYYTEDDNISYYQGTNVLSLQGMEKLRAPYEKLYSICENRGIKLGVIIAPNKEQVYPEFLPSFRVKDGQKREIIFAEYMKENSKVPFVYPLNELVAAKEEYDVYSMQDSHWNEFGAYIALKALYNVMDMNYLSFDNPQIFSKRTCGGDLSSLCGFTVEYTTYSVNYRPEIVVTTSDENYFGRESFCSTSDNNHKLVLIGDSFRQAFKTLPIKDFSQSKVFIRNKIEEDEAVIRALNELSEGDVLIILSAERFDEIMSQTVENICSLFY